MSNRVLWQPSTQRITASNMAAFMKMVNKRFGLHNESYGDLYQWSVDHIPQFWETFLQFSNIQFKTSYTAVVDDLGAMPGARWFEGATLNFAEQLLAHRDEQTAIIACCEHRPPVRISHAQLYAQVRRLALALQRQGIQPGDRVVGFMPNIAETVVAMLAATSLGATWSSCSPDFGMRGVLDRFGQTKPRVLFTADGYAFKGRQFDSLERVRDMLGQLASVEQVVVVPFIDAAPGLDAIPNAVLWNDYLADDTDADIPFTALPFDHPLYIMYSSGTTGLPKCMVQSAGGVLLNQLKEMVLHTDMKREDTIFYFTSCGWMMWNWLASALAVGATIVLYDGNPFHTDHEALWRMAEEHEITVFGTSAGYISALQNLNADITGRFALPRLRTILSTGSPLSEENFEYVYKHIKKDVQLASISGGSDLNGCFALGNPFDPVYCGELQSRGLGMRVVAFDEHGQEVIGRKGELVCTAPFPSMPIYFWDDPDGAKYRSAYFNKYPGVWRHGDFILINEHGGMVIYGRSDATLNPGGVRIGTAEIYRQVEQIPEIEDSLVIGQPWKNDVRVVLFVKLNQGFTLDDAMADRIRRAIRTNASPRHVPAKIISVPGIPYTLSMKKVEIAVRKAIAGESISNRDALRNPEVLDFYAGIEALQEE
ncbi:MAG: acetoacetate--CoA ligase [Desulfatitalea sp.]|nr:acetoacetate--CoA ligase [Desulfatitalea sp.]NNJ98807.1 acetoacetate--CoA ligase [Desulfatitalea sp.]